MWEITSPLADRLFTIFNVVLILGAAMVLIGTIGAIVLSGVREQFSNARISENETKTAQAIAESDNAKKGAAEANARALEARLALENFKAPRTLRPDQQAKIAEKLKPFAGTIYDAGIGPMGDPEPLYMLRSLHVALSSANWKHVAWTGSGDMTYTEPDMPSMGVTMVTNVIVDVHPDRWKELGPAAEALAAALSAEGIDAIADSKPTSINSNAIHIRIGRKL